MPTPIGHALGGLIVGLLISRGGSSDLPPRSSGPPPGTATPNPRVAGAGVSTAGLKTRLYWCAVAACLPDLDFFWGRHNMETHSLGFAVIVGLLVLVWKRETWLAAGATLAVGTHVLFDWLGSDDFPPLGVMALWPVTRDFYFANAFVFEAISRRYWLPGFVTHNLLAVVREIAILGPILAGAWWLRVSRLWMDPFVASAFRRKS